MNESIKARDRAIAQVERNADSEWLKQARIHVLMVADRKGVFTADDVWDSGLPRVREPRALGTVMVALCREDKIHPTGTYVNTRRASRHHAPIREWCSA